MVILAVVKVAWYAINPTGHKQGSFQTTTATKRLNRQLSLKLVCGVMNTQHKQFIGTADSWPSIANQGEIKTLAGKNPATQA